MLSSRHRLGACINRNELGDDDMSAGAQFGVALSRELNGISDLLQLRDTCVDSTFGQGPHMPNFSTFEWTVLGVLLAGLFGTWSYLQQLERLLRAIGTSVALLLPDDEE